MPGVAYHVTQRGVVQGKVFSSQADRDTHLRLASEQMREAGARVLARCQMDNRVYWVVVPEREDSLAALFRRVHGRYAHT